MTDYELFEYNQCENWTKHSAICDMIEQNFTDRFDTSIRVGGYSKIISDIKWPDDEVKDILRQADYLNSDNPKVILVTGVVIDIEFVNEKTRNVWLCDDPELWKNPNDYKLLLQLSATKNSQNCIVAFEAFDNRSNDYTIGPIEKLRPGTRVKMAVFNLNIVSNSTNLLRAGFTDIIEYRCDPENAYKRENDEWLEYVDSQYKIHGQDDYLKAYCVLAENMKIGHAQLENNKSKENAFKGDETQQLDIEARSFAGKIYNTRDLREKVENDYNSLSEWFVKLEEFTENECNILKEKLLNEKANHYPEVIELYLAKIENRLKNIWFNEDKNKIEDIFLKTNIFSETSKSESIQKILKIGRTEDKQKYIDALNMLNVRNINLINRYMFVNPIGLVFMLIVVFVLLFTCFPIAVIIGIIWIFIVSKRGTANEIWNKISLNETLIHPAIKGIKEKADRNKS